MKVQIFPLSKEVCGMPMLSKKVYPEEDRLRIQGFRRVATLRAHFSNALEGGSRKDVFEAAEIFKDVMQVQWRLVEKMPPEDVCCSMEYAWKDDNERRDRGVLTPESLERAFEILAGR